MWPTIAEIATVIVVIGTGVIGIVMWFPTYARKEERTQPEPHPTKYQTEPPTLAMEIHRGKHAVILKTRNDRTVVRQEDMMALSDELRKYHTTISTLNEIIGMDDIKAEETTQNEPPDPNALPERVEVKGWDGESMKDIHDAVPDAGYAGRSLYRMMEGVSDVNPTSGYADFLANSFSDMVRPEYEQFKVEQFIKKTMPYTPPDKRHDLARRHIDRCRRAGTDPLAGLEGPDI